MYAPTAALFQLESLNMIIQEGTSAYPSDIHSSNEYLLEYNAQLVQHIIDLLQDQYMPTVALAYFSPRPSIFQHTSHMEFPHKGIPQF